MTEETKEMQRLFPLMMFTESRQIIWAIFFLNVSKEIGNYNYKKSMETQLSEHKLYSCFSLLLLKHVHNYLNRQIKNRKTRRCG